MYRKLKTENYQNISQMYHVSELLGKIVDSFGYSNDEISSFFHPIEKFELDEKVFQPLKETLYRIKQDKKRSSFSVIMIAMVYAQQPSL